MEFHSGRRLAGYGVALLFSLLPLPTYAAANKSDAWAHNQFAIAEQKRQALQNLAPEEQTRRQYQDVINSYRRVYYGSPTSSKADASVFAVAEVLAETGCRFMDASLFRSSITQYQFLRREYPGSKYRFEALFNIGQLYAQDIKDDALAKKTFEDFIKQYPQHHLAQNAQLAIDNSGNPHAEESAAKDANRNQESTASGVTTRTVIADDSTEPTHITGIHYLSKAGYTRVTIDLDRAVGYKSQRIESPDRIFFDLGAKISKKLIKKTIDVNDVLLTKIRVSQFKPDHARIVLEIGEHSDFTASLETNPSRLVIDLRDSEVRTQGLDNKDIESSSSHRPEANRAMPEMSKAISPLPPKRIVEADNDDSQTTATLAPPVPPLPAKSNSVSSTNAADRRSHRRLDGREAQPTAAGDRSLIRALGLKIGKIVIDPGHGGYDTGTIGPNSLEEKDLVLDVSRRLGKLLESRLGAQVVYTRKDDTFVPLETRTAIANQEQADLFVSVHANSSHDPSARGVETYYLNFNSSPDALEVAARENAVSETSIHELQDLVKQIALKEKIEESREFASDVQQELHNGLAAKNPGLRNRGVKKAPFIVLIGANMPSILAEISFVSNPGDEKRCETAAYRQRIAESLYRGISKYVSGLSGIKVASKIDKTSGQ